MRNSLTFRPAGAADYQDGARLIMLTLHGFGCHLFGFGDLARAQAALEKFFHMDANRFSYRYTLFGESAGEIAGILMLFNRPQMRWSMLVLSAFLPRVYRLGEISKFTKLMGPYRDEEKLAGDELYIAHLAVYEQFRRQGFGLNLLAAAEKEARNQGKKKLSLLTEIENDTAQALYTKFGFKITDTFRLPEDMQFSGSAGDVRMEKTL